MLDEAELISRLYVSAVEPDGLERMSLLVRQALDIDSAGFWLTRGPEVIEMANTPDIQASEPAYLARYHALDPWTVRDPAKFGTVSLACETFDERDLLKTEFYQEFARHFGMLRPMGVTIDLGEGLLATVATNRMPPGPLLGDPDKARLQGLVIHLAAALRLRVRFAALQTVAAVREEALDALSFALVACDGEGRVAFANREAERLARGPGPIAIAGGRLSAVAAADRDRLCQALRKAASGEGAGVRLSDRTGSSIGATVTPAPSRIGGGIGGVLLSLPPSRSPDPDAFLRQAFGLTAAQAELCRALSAGLTFAEAAGAKGVAVTTMRTHFRAVLARTGTTNLRDLLRLLASMPQVAR